MPPETFEIPAALLARCVNRTDLVQRVLHCFIQQLDQDIPRLVASVESDCSEAARELAHRIKGAAANVAAESLRANAEQIEEFAANQKLADLKVPLSSLQSNWETYKNQTAAFLS